MSRRIFFTFFIKGIIAVTNLLIVILLSRYTGAAGKGEASLIITSIAMILLFNNIVGGAALVYFVPRNNIFQLIFLSNCWSFIICCIAYAILFFTTIIPPQFLLHVVILSFINALFSTNSTILLGKERITQYNIILLFQATLNLISLFIMFKWGNSKNVNSYISSLYISMLSCLLISSSSILKYLKDISFKNIKSLGQELVKLGVTNQIGHTMKFISFRFTYYILSIYAGASILGIYSNGVSLVESVLIISNSFCTILYPRVANSKDIKKSQLLTIQYIKINFILSAICLISMSLLPSTFYVWLFGSEFSNVNQVVYLLAPGICVYSVSLIVGHYLSGTGNYKTPSYANLVGLITTVLLVLIFAPKFGLFEISIISTISYIATAGFITYYFIKKTNFKIKDLLPTINDFNLFCIEIKTIIKGQ
ncbi:MAG: polysaccharide biosynthesis C-terminal domain-containing protein [Bacteroidia bacterium]